MGNVFEDYRWIDEEKYFNAYYLCDFVYKQIC